MALPWYKCGIHILYNWVSDVQMNRQVMNDSSHQNGIKHHTHPQSTENSKPREQTQPLSSGERKVGIYTIS